MKKSLLASQFILVATLIFAPAALAQKLVIAWTAVSAFNSPFWIMSDAGLYKEEGLDVDTMYIASSPIAAKATLAGEVVISAQNSQVIADSGLQGADLVAIGATVNIVPFYIMAAPEINSVTDLKGKTVGVSRFGAATDFGMRMFLAKHGLAAHRDVAFIQIGGMPEIATALSKKIIAAAPMSYPMVYVAEQGGAKVLANLAKDEIPFQHLRAALFGYIDHRIRHRCGGRNSVRALDLDNHEALSQRQAAAGESFFARLRQGDALSL